LYIFEILAVRSGGSLVIVLALLAVWLLGERMTPSRAGDATLVVPLDFMRIPLIAVVGRAFYGERLDIFVLLGAMIIVAGVLWNLRAESRRAS